MYAMGCHTYVSSPATQIRNNPAKLEPCINESNSRLKAAKSGHSLTLVGKPFQSLVVKYDHDLRVYSKLKDGSMRRVLATLKL